MSPRWSLLAFLLMAGALLSGCLQGGTTNDGKTGTQGVHAPRVRLDPPAALAFATPVSLGMLGGGAEPSVAAGPDGTMYVTTPLALWRSTDKGATWSWLGTPTCPANLPQCPLVGSQASPGIRGGGDADLYVGPDNRVHWLGLADGNNAIPYQSSSDRGASWGTVLDLADNSTADREWITGRTNGTLFAAWRDYPPTGKGDPMIVMRASYDGGSTWTKRSEIAKDTRQGGIAVDPTSNALALAYDQNGPVQVARSVDDGKTWTSTQVVSDPVLGHVFPVLAYDLNGTLYLIYSHDPKGDPLPADPAGSGRPFEHPNVYMAVSHDKGVTWTKPVQVNKAGTTAWFPWVAAGAAGRVVVTWYQSDMGLPRQAGGQVYVMAAVSLDADFPSPRFTVQRADPNPVHTGPECRENPGVCTRSLLDFFEVAIHPDGFPFLAYATDTYPVTRDVVKTVRLQSGVDLLH